MYVEEIHEVLSKTLFFPVSRVTTRLLPCFSRFDPKVDNGVAWGGRRLCHQKLEVGACLGWVGGVFIQWCLFHVGTTFVQLLFSCNRKTWKNVDFLKQHTWNHLKNPKFATKCSLLKKNCQNGTLKWVWPGVAHFVFKDFKYLTCPGRSFTGKLWKNVICFSQRCHFRWSSWANGNCWLAARFVLVDDLPRTWWTRQCGPSDVMTRQGKEKKKRLHVRHWMVKASASTVSMQGH